MRALPPIKINALRIKGVVFDLDDTLYPERDFVLSGFRAVAEWAESNLNIPTEAGMAELKKLFENGVRGDTFERWRSNFNLVEKVDITVLVQVYRRHTPNLCPFPEVPSVLNYLGKHYKLGLLSDGFLAVQKSKLASLGLERHFDEIIFSDEWGRDAWKPSTKPFSVMLKRLNLEPQMACYIADNALKDFIGPKALGMHTIWVRRQDTGYSMREPPSESYEADVAVSSLTEILDFL